MATASILPDPNPEKVSQPLEQWDNVTAFRRAWGDFQKMQQYRMMNHDRRFRASDELYLAYVIPKNWEGTKIRRASVPVYMLLQQVESMLPKAINGLLSDDPPFDVANNPSSTIQAALAVKHLIRYQLQDLGEPQKRLTLRRLLHHLLKSEFIYGNGVAEFGWIVREIERMEHGRYVRPVLAAVPHPLTGEPVPVPTGQYQIGYQQQQVKKLINKPCFWPTDIRDFYIDPHCPTTNVQDANMCATRHLLTIDQFKELVNGDEFDIPSDAELLDYAKSKSATPQDMDKLQTEAYRGNSYNPATDQSTDPNKKRLEVIRYWTKERHIWIIPQRKDRPVYNKSNCYGVHPFLSSAYTNVPGRWYALSMADIVEGDQHLAEVILNARIDELNLMIHRPLVKKRGLSFPASQQRMAPGRIWEADKPKEDFVMLEFGNVTAQAFAEYEQLERRVQKATGLSDIFSGAPAVGGNSANRTATGVSAQIGGGSERVQYIVGDFEDEVLAPMLDVILALDQKFLTPDQLQPILGPMMQQLQLDPTDVLNASVRFIMLGSQKMKTRQALQSGGLQVLLQAIPEIAQFMQQQGKKINSEALSSLVFDTLNLKAQDLFVQMTPEEIQALQQPSPDKMIALQMQNDRLDSQGEHQDSSDETKLLVALINKLVTPEAAAAILKELGMSAPMKLMEKAAQKPQLAAKNK